ncbi:MAG: sugar transferase [Rhodothermia bacterium]|nr:sugar transferase [Rhodothermia bacterium]
MTATGKISPRAYPAACVLLGRLAAALLLVVTAPVLLLIAILIYASDRGPVLFRQVRTGLQGEIFLIYKFRTMRGADRGRSPDSEMEIVHLHRTTRVGLTLRRFGLDELPQLLNIVRGDMCFVGPRPTLPEQVARYEDHHRLRLSVRPGLTGWAQVNGRNKIGWQERIEMDIWYVQNRSPRLDLKILVSTIPTLLKGTGAYGQDGTNPDFHPMPSQERAKAA